jgi:hypothetical protein
MTTLAKGSQMPCAFWSANSGDTVERVDMNAKLSHRVEQLEERGSTADEPEEEPLRITSWREGQNLSLDRDTCVRILRESGHQTGSVRLDRIPDGLSAEELTTFLREHGGSL